MYKYSTMGYIVNFPMRTVSTLLSLILVSGCANNPLYRGYAARPLAQSLVAGGSYMNLVSELQRVDANYGALLPASCFAAELGNEKANCRTRRNHAISALVIGSGELCMDHRRSMYGNDAMWNIAFGTLTNLFAGAASVVTKEKFRPVLAALALFSNSERSLINETVYKQMLVTSVDKKILEMREARMAVIHESLKADIEVYTAPEALRDVVALHSTCSFIDGLQKALEEGTQDTSAKKILRLRESLRALTNQYKALDPTKDKVQLAGLEARIDALTQALKVEEIR